MQACMHVFEMRAMSGAKIVHHFGDMMDECTRIGEQHWTLEGNLQDMLAKDTIVTVSLNKA